MLKQISSAAVVVAALACQEAQAGATSPFISGSYYEQNATNCTNPVPPGSSSGSEVPSACQLLFSPPPAGKQLRLSNVACSIKISGVPLQDLYLGQNINGTVTRKHPLDPTPQGSYNGTFFYTLNEPVGDYLVTAPVRVVLDIPASRSASMECQIIGSVPSTGSV